jgi:putative nucleotidyltransferase with HDIG domain
MMARLTLDQVKAAVQDLPALPSVVLKVLQTFRQDNPDLDLLAREIAGDQALATRVLRLANSPFYGLQTKVGSLQDAITVLGFRNVRAAVAGIAVLRCFARSPCAGFNLDTFQRHGMAAALAARAIARQAQLPEELAFSAGLVHDIGALALLTAFPEPMAEVLAYATRHDCALREAEREVLGIDHASVGDALLRHWHFPEEICLAVLGHHDSSAIGGLADVIHVADVLVHGLAAAEHAGGRVPPLSDIAYNRLGLSVGKLKQVMHEVSRDFEPVRQALSI